MIYNHSQTCFTNLASIIWAKTTSNKCMQHSCFASMFHMFRSRVSVIIYMIRHIWLGCLMMHDMHDLQCLNAGITPGCYNGLPAALYRTTIGQPDGRRSAYAARAVSTRWITDSDSHSPFGGVGVRPFALGPGRRASVRVDALHVVYLKAKGPTILRACIRGVLGCPPPPPSRGP